VTAAGGSDPVRDSETRKKKEETMAKCSEWAWLGLYRSGYTLECIAPLFPVSTRNLHVSLAVF